MRHILPVVIVAALRTNMDATRNHYAAPTPATDISVVLPRGMKSFPVGLPQ